MSTIQYTSTPPAAVRASIASYLASRGATWCDYASCGAAAIIAAMRPISERIPVAVTIARPWP